MKWTFASFLFDFNLKKLRLHLVPICLFVIVSFLTDVARASDGTVITGVYAPAGGQDKQTAVIGGKLNVVITVPRAPLNPTHPFGTFDKLRNAVLYIGDQPFQNLLVRIDSANLHKKELTLTYRLRLNDKNRKQWQELFNDHFLAFYLKDVQVTLAPTADSRVLPVKSNSISINLLHTGVLRGIVIFLLLLIAAIIYLSLKKELIRDDVDLKDLAGRPLKGKRPYSLSRTQFAWWTVIIVGAFVYLWAVNMSIPELNEEALVLLGISILTNTGAKLIDDRQSDKLQHQSQPSDGFLLDVLSDGKGINIHRFQMAVWTLVFGVIYIIMVIRDHQFPELGGSALFLMGLSSATYLAMKGTENQKAESLSTAPKPAPAAPAEEEEPAG